MLYWYFMPAQSFPGSKLHALGIRVRELWPTIHAAEFHSKRVQLALIFPSTTNSVVENSFSPRMSSCLRVAALSTGTTLDQVRPEGLMSEHEHDEYQMASRSEAQEPEEVDAPTCKFSEIPRRIQCSSKPSGASLIACSLLSTSVCFSYGQHVHASFNSLLEQNLQYLSKSKIIRHVQKGPTELASNIKAIDTSSHTPCQRQLGAGRCRYFYQRCQ